MNANRRFDEITKVGIDLGRLIGILWIIMRRRTGGSRGRRAVRVGDRRRGRGFHGCDMRKLSILLPNTMTIISVSFIQRK